MYKCKDCNKPFEEPATEPEIHGFKNPPFDKGLVCPDCGLDNIEEVEEKEQHIDKEEVAKVLINAIARLNRLHAVISDKNGDLQTSIYNLEELVVEMADPDDTELAARLFYLHPGAEEEICMDLFMEALQG